MLELIEKVKEVTELMTRFHLNDLDSEWVKSVINADFTEVTDIPVDFEDLHCSTNFLGLFDAVINTLRNFIDLIPSDYNNASTVDRRSSCSFLSTSSIVQEEYEHSDVFTKFWVNTTKVFSVKSFLSFLFYYIHKGQQYDANENARELGIHATSLYFLLLAVPGSNAFRFFHPILYLKSLDIMKLTTKLNVGASSPKKGSNRGSRPSNRKSSEDVMGGDDDEEAEISYLTPNEANKLIRSLNVLLNDFLRLSNKFSLKHSSESLDETISVLVEVTRCEIHNSQGVFLQRHAANSVTSLTYNAYVALQSICNPLHGNLKKIVVLIMKYMMYNILMISRGSSDLSTRALGVIREHSIIFVKYLMIQLKKDALEAVYILVQHLCLRVPDKADFREKTAKSVVQILKTFPLKEYSQLLKWLFQFSHNEKAGHRLFTLEVISKLLTEEERQEEEQQNESSTRKTDSSKNSDTEKEQNGDSFQSIPTDHNLSVPINRNVLSHNFLLCIIFSRCRDSAATVRSKALALLSECTLSDNPSIVESMKQVFFNQEPIVFTTPHIPDNEINCESPTEQLNDQLKLPNAEIVMSMLQRRALDDKVTVRKSALQVMENLMKLKNEMITDKYLKPLVEHCKDPALLIRKQMVNSLTSIVSTYPSSEVAIKTWVLGVFPLILDPEMKVQEKVVEFVDQLIFRRMRRHGSLSLTAEQELPWRILDTITVHSFHKFFNKILMMWSKSVHMSPEVISFAKSHIGGEFNEQAWTFLSIISQYIDIKDSLFVLDYFEENSLSNNEVGAYTLQRVLKVLGHSIKHFPAERAENLQTKLLSLITSLSVSVELISSMINIITLISYSMDGNEEEGQKAIEVWATPILKSCDDYLKQILFPENPLPLTKEEEDRFFRYLFTLGEVCQLCPWKVNKRMFLMLQSIIFHQNHSLNTCPTNLRIPSTQTQSSQAPTVSFNPTRRLKTLSVITLGKMCLHHEDQAKRIIPAMGRMLDTTTLPAMKINIIIVLSDMCVRYATLVDPLMPQVTACLRDSDIQVRRTTLTLLINLLQEDYLKLKGSFFYRILQCLCDDDDYIRNTVIFYMTERLLKRFPKIFIQHFIECIFHYNCYEEHESYNKFSQSTQEKELFSLGGRKFREERMMLYRFMLDHMQDDQRFATTQRLCQDVLGGVVDGRIKLTSSSVPMLEDTLMVLSSDEIKLAWLRSNPDDADQPTDQAEQAEMAGIAIKKTIISQVVKRNVIENIVPILIALKHKLAENKSPLMKQLLLYFKEIMKDYKNEVKEILTADKQFAKEIEFDLRKLEEQQQREEERAQEERNLELEARRQEQANPKPSLGTSPKLIQNVVVERGSIQSLEKTPEQLNLSQTEGEDETEKSKSRDRETPEDQVGLEGEIEGQKVARSVKESEEMSDTPPPPPSSPPPLSPRVRKKSNVSTLLKQALINNQKKVERHRITSVVEEELGDNEECEQNADNEDKRETLNKSGTVLSKEQDEVETPGVPNVDNNVGDVEKETCFKLSEPVSGGLEVPTNTETDKTPPSDIPPTIPCTPPKESAEKATDIRNNLMRAISTPNPNQKVIDDITFVNRTQEISGISLNDTAVSCRDDPKADSENENGPHTILLHFRSPEAFAKDEQFSRLRRNSRKSLTKEFARESLKERKQDRSGREATKRPSGGFMESYSDREPIISEEDSSFMQSPKPKRPSIEISRKKSETHFDDNLPKVLRLKQTTINLKTVKTNKRRKKS